MSAISAWFNGLITDITLWFDGFSAAAYRCGCLSCDSYDFVLACGQARKEAARK